MQSTLMPASIRPVFDELIQKRVVNPRHFGKPGLLRRALRMRLLSGVVLAAPALVLCFWYIAVALAAHYRHARAVDVVEPLSLHVFHLHLHDRLTHDRRRLLMPDALGESSLPTYELRISNSGLDQLDQTLPPGDGDAYYVDAHLIRGNDIYPVKVRYRGRKPWHWNAPQKSYKVRMQGGNLFDGRGTFNFVNTPEPMPFDEHLIFSIAHEEGLLTPDYYPFRLFLNNAYWGVYFFETQPDEGLLRRSRRMPGSIYSGNGAPPDSKTGVSTLWNVARHWQKVAAIEQEQMDDFEELEALIAAVNEPSDEQFMSFAARFIDLDKFALFDALDVVFGVNEHDFENNHKLYFDPYRGRYEPIAWDFRGGEHESELNRTENPLLLRLKQIPEYLTRRNRTVLRLLDGPCSTQALRARASALLDELKADQERDPYWDAYELLPSMGPYFRQLPRPMNRELQAVAVDARLGQYAERERFVRTALTGEEVSAVVPVGQPPSGELAIDVLVGGMAGLHLTEVEVAGTGTCEDQGWELFADTDLSDALDYSTDRHLVHADGNTPTAFDLVVYPGVRLVPRKPHRSRGLVRTEPETRRYRLFLNSGGCRPDEVIFRGVNLVTSAPFTVELDSVAPTDVSPIASIECELEFHPTPDESSPHPWCLDAPSAERVQLGPGAVEIPKTRVFEPYQTVEIVAGTTLFMGPNASLVFLGKVTARGRLDAPIRIVPRRDRWGGIALQGPGTAGSRLVHVIVERGRRPAFGIVHYPGMINVHDTDSIELAHLSVRANSQSDDALHAAYVRDLVVRHSEFVDTASDAIDLEFTTATLDDITVRHAGDDAVDLMTSNVKVSNSRFVDFTNNAVSAGEWTEASIESCLAAKGEQGILVKNSSSVSLSNVLVYRATVGLQLEPVSQWYTGKSHVHGETFHAVQCRQQVAARGRKLKKLGRIASQVRSGELEALQRQLGIREWEDLDAAVQRLEAGSQ